jgi:hypothetical protein
VCCVGAGRLLHLCDNVRGSGTVDLMDDDSAGHVDAADDTSEELGALLDERAAALLGQGAVAIVRERRRQIAEEGFSVLRDRELFTTELAQASQAYVAAALYAQATGRALGLAPDSWPWPAELFKPSPDPARNLEKAGALIAAELDRLHSGR